MSGCHPCLFAGRKVVGLGCPLTTEEKRGKATRERLKYNVTLGFLQLYTLSAMHKRPQHAPLSMHNDNTAIVLRMLCDLNVMNVDGESRWVIIKYLKTSFLEVKNALKQIQTFLRDICIGLGGLERILS